MDFTLVDYTHNLSLAYGIPVPMTSSQEEVEQRYCYWVNFWSCECEYLPSTLALNLTGNK